jgi:hypothetical protein
VIFYGEKGILMHDTYGSNPRIYPDSLHSQAQSVPKTMPRITWSTSRTGSRRSSRKRLPALRWSTRRS